VAMSLMREVRRCLSAEQSVPGFDPCLPRSADQPPAGPGWIHEIKHDGFRILAHRLGRAGRLITRNGHDLADRFPLAAAAIEALPVRSCVVGSGRAKGDCANRIQGNAKLIVRDGAGRHRRHRCGRQSYDEKSRPAHVRSLLHCAAGRQRLYGAPPATNLSKKTPAPNSKKEPERATAPYCLIVISASSAGRSGT
jgi:hypothetical protein